MRYTTWLIGGTVIALAFSAAAHATTPQATAQARDAGARSDALSSRITPDQLVERVLSSNADLRAARYTLQVAEAGVTAAGAYPNPRVEWGLGPYRAVGAAGGPGTNGRAQAIGVVQPIENPALRASRVEAAKLGVAYEQRSLDDLQNELAARTRLLAYESLLREEEALAAADAEALLEQARNRVKLRVESGEAARYEIIKADAELTSARQRKVQAQLQAEQVRLRINRLAAGGLPNQWRVDATLADTSIPAQVTLEPSAAALEQNPGLVALRANAQRRDALTREARASVMPSVDVALMQTREPGVRQHMAGLTVSIPIFDRKSGQIAAASAEYSRAMSLVEGRQAELQQEWRLAVKSLEMAQSRVRALSQGAVREAEAALRVAEAAYRFGERGILDVLDAQRVLRAVRADLLQARFEVQAAVIELDRLQGRSGQTQRST